MSQTQRIHRAAKKREHPPASSAVKAMIDAHLKRSAELFFRPEAGDPYVIIFGDVLTGTSLDLLGDIREACQALWLSVHPPTISVRGWEGWDPVGQLDPSMREVTIRTFLEGQGLPVLHVCGGGRHFVRMVGEAGEDLGDQMLVVPYWSVELVKRFARARRACGAVFRGNINRKAKQHAEAFRW